MSADGRPSIRRVPVQPGDRRTYTYHWDGEPFAVGDKVVVTTNRGPAAVTVESVSDIAPAFETKPIVGREPAAPATPSEEQ